jgi:ferric-dicitrate binding protein FerR (iron transport regulator)
MILRIKKNDFLRMRGARGVAIAVLEGRVWITEDGASGDSFLDAGRSYRVGGDGLVLIGTESYREDAPGDGVGAEIAISVARQAA